MSADLDAGVLNGLVAEFTRAENEITAAVSGSHARGDAGPFSDTDLRLYSERQIEGGEPELVFRRGPRGRR